MNQQPTSLDTAPTNARYRVLGFACTLSMITYLDRVCFGAAVPHIVEALGLQSVADLQLAFTAFAFAYAAFEIPSGWLGDTYGPRNTLIRIVLWWSAFTVLTGCVYQFSPIKIGMGERFPYALFINGLVVMVVIRFLFGMGEAGAYPNITRALHNWFPGTERAVGQGAVWMAGRFMGGITPLLWMFVVEWSGLSWRGAFFIFGGIGVLWCIAFATWFRNKPEESPKANEAERVLIAAGREPEADHAHVPWMKMLRSTNLWALCLMYFCAAYGWYFNITYLPSFLADQHHVDPKSIVGSIYKGGPLWMGAITCLIGGWLSDRFIRKTGNRKWGRRLFGLIGHALCGLCYFACIFTPTAFTFFLAVSLAAFWNDLTMGAAWATCQDIGRRYAAIVAGCMNTVGNLGGAAAGWVTGHILQLKLTAYAAAKGVAVVDLSAAEKAEGLLPGYHINFVLFGMVYMVALLFWLRIDATEPVLPVEPAKTETQGA